ncbi:MAG: cell division protein FtsZ, partial [Nonlabens sp.]
LPFTFEGIKITTQGVEGLEELKANVDSLIVISNDKLRQIHGNLSLGEAFCEADSVLTTAAKGIAEIITVAGYVNVDFEDVNTVMRSSGVAIMGTSQAEGEDRAKRAVDEALNSPLLEDNHIKGAQHILLNITSGTKEVTMDEVFEITEFVQEEAGYGTNLIWGNCFDETLGDAISVTVIATGFEHIEKDQEAPETEKVRISLDEDDRNKPGFYEVGHNDGDKAKTVEFDDVRDSLTRYNRTGYSYEEPYLKSEEKKQLEMERRLLQEEEALRREKERLRNARVKLSNPNTVSDLENQPAYLRRRVNLDDNPKSEELNRSRWTISDDEEPELKSDNSYLHDNVD